MSKGSASSTRTVVASRAGSTGWVLAVLCMALFLLLVAAVPGLAAVTAGEGQTFVATPEPTGYPGTGGHEAAVPSATPDRASSSSLPGSPSLDSSIEGTATQPAKLAIYYGWPSVVNGAAGDVNLAAAEFAQFDMVVLGDGLEHPSHGDHANTVLIINQLLARGVEVYGYIDMGVKTQNLPIATAQQYVDEWQAMGVTGILWDDAGYDYGVDRARQTALIDYTHSQGLVAFVNAWVPADVFDEDGGVPSPLAAGDWYLAESHPIASGQFADLGFWWNKSQSLSAYRQQTGVRIAAIATGDDGPTGWANSGVYRQSLWAAYLFDWDAFGFTNDQYSATGDGADRLRAVPDVATDSGATFTGPPTMMDGSTYTRGTDNGTIIVFGDDSSGGGAFQGGACDTTGLGPVIWPNCSDTPPAQSSPYGPRQKASDAYRYDWHRGVDIPQPLGEPVYAMIDGVVRIAGSHPAYSDLIVQIRHRESLPYLYTNVLHLESAAVAEGDLVTVGDLVGYSGASDSGFAHMHAEFRDGCLYQDCNRNPWGYLPYVDQPPVAPVLLGGNLGTAGSLLLLETSTLPDQLDLDGLTVTWKNSTTAAGFEAINATTDRDFPEGLDHPVVELDGGVSVCILPGQFNAQSSQATYRFAYGGLPIASSGSAAGLDLNGSGTPVNLLPDLLDVTLSSPAQQATSAPGGTVTFQHVVQNNGAAAVNLNLSAQSAQNNDLSLSHATLSLAAGASETIAIEVTLSASFPVPVGDCVVLEIDGGTGHSLIAVDSAVTNSDPPTPTPTPTPCPLDIEITYVPAYGSLDDLQGETTCAASQDYGVAVYIYVEGWWTKPTFASPLTPIQTDGTWITDITTGPGDEFATEVAAFLIPAGYDPPQMGGGQTLPQELYDNAEDVDMTQRGPSVRTVQFSGITWKVKSSESPVGPGPNYFSDSVSDVWVDESDRLHLRIANRDDRWYSSEVYTDDPLGYGTYAFTLASRVDLLDRNIVLGLFTWDDAAPEHNYREIDIEMARWGEETNDNSQFVVQPWDQAGNMYRFDTVLLSDYSTHAFDWTAGGVQFSSHQGHGAPPGDEIASWLYTGPDVPPEGQGNARINLWLYNGSPPSDGQEAEVIVEAFAFAPPTTPPLVDQVATGEEDGAGAVSGSYADTHTNDGIAQAITERESGGKPSKRHSYLEHTWLFDVQAGSAVTFNASAWAPASGDGDSFTFAWSEDGSAWTEMFTVTATSDDDSYQAFALPSSTAGTVRVRVTDTDRSQGHRDLDTVYVDHAFIRTELVPGGPPAAPTDLTASAISASQIQLAWIDHARNETGYEVERSPDGVGNWALAGATGPDATGYLDTGLSASTTYFYRVRATNGSGASSHSNPASATTDQASTVHVGDMDPASSTVKNRWNASVTITIHEVGHSPVSGASVSGSWNAGTLGGGTCVTGADGRCSITKTKLKTSVGSVTFAVDGVTLSGHTYEPGANHDPDGDSDGTTVLVLKPY